eukprot:Hpha_TRINITY_DN609_c0_g1::TRINITY_DN609_c0_g1_i2::g.21230::m.21230
MSILDAQPLPSVQHDIDDMQYDAYVTRRERFSLLYSGGFIRWFYAVCLALTVFLVAWTASTGDHRSWWVKVLEALLTLSFAGEVWLRVWIHPRGLRQSRTVGAEAALSAVCVVVWLSSEILGSWLDELDDVLLGVRYAAQSIRILYFARAELLASCLGTEVLSQRARQIVTQRALRALGGLLLFANERETLRAHKELASRLQ